MILLKYLFFQTDRIHSLYTNTDFVAKFVLPLSPLVNWLTATGTPPRWTRVLMEKVLGFKKLT